MSLLGIAYAETSIEEPIEEKKQKEEERVRDLKIYVFCYADRNCLNYNNVMKMIQDKKLTIDDIERDRKEYERKKRRIKN